MISNNSGTVNEFSGELWETIEARLSEAARTHRGPKIAAFDADGTLWDADAGETFFDWQITRAGLSGLPADPWAHYEEMKAENPIPAYVWLAQISAGVPLTQVREWAAICFREHSPWPYFSSQQNLFSRLRALDFEIYIVTASIKWAVEPAAQLLGVDADHVLGITTQIENGRIGMRAVHPVTWREGKATGLLAATGGVHPILASGNTYGDIAMLETATHVQLAVSTQVTPGGLFEEEQKLATFADTRGWLRHGFRRSTSAAALKI